MWRIPAPELVLACCALALAPDGPGQGGARARAGAGRAAHPRASAPAASDAVPKGLSTEDWSSIRAAYEADRHSAFAVDGGFHARNPGQQWATRFDGRGFTTTPDSGGWSWGLELASFGFPGAERTIEGRARVEVEGARVRYEWDSMLEEWYANDSRGLEHGYTVHARPTRAEDAEGPLTFTLAVRGGLRAEAQPDGRGARFSNENGAVVVTYSGLKAFDAEGRILPARLERVAEGLRLIVQEDGAPYPLTIDPMAQQAYLKASNTGAGDRFGVSVAISGDTVVVGANAEDSKAKGVNGGQKDNSTLNCGAAYVFVKSGTTWSQQAYLKASNPGALDYFGSAVAIWGDTVVVGAYREDSNAIGVNGNQNDNSAESSGAAYVFARSGTTWSQQAYLKASNTGAEDHFASDVSISGDTVVVGAYIEDSNATGVNGNQNDNSVFGSGAAYVFVRTGTTWSQQAYLKASNTDAGDWFGLSVSVSGDTVVVGAYREDSNATGVNGNQSDNSGIEAGAAYVFVRSGTTWSQQAYLKASNTGAQDYFSSDVSISGDTVVVGAYREDSNAMGVNGNQSDNSALDSGAAYVFVRHGTTWSQQAYLKASNSGTLDYFGDDVSISSDTVVVGAALESSNATGVNGNQSDNSAGFSGAAYVFERYGTTWGQQAYLKASNTDAGDEFGASVAVSGDTVVVGAYNEDSKATGVNGSQSDDSISGSGAAYAFDPIMIPLTSDVSAVSLSSGGTQSLLLEAGIANQNDLYLLLGSMTGTSPGVPAPPWGVLPLNADTYFFLTLTSPNSPPLGSSLGSLDLSGKSTATFTVPPGSNPGFAGIRVNHAYLVLDLSTGSLAIPLISNAVPCDLVP